MVFSGFFYGFVFFPRICLRAFTYAYVIVEYFAATEGKIKKAIIATITPCVAIPVTGLPQIVLFCCVIVCAAVQLYCKEQCNGDFRISGYLLIYQCYVEFK